MIEPELALFQMKIESILRNSMKFYQPVFGKGPKGLNAVNVLLATGKFIRTMVDSVMLFIANINQAIIATPPIRMDDTLRTHLAPYYRLQRGFGAIWYDLGINFSSALKNAKDRRFTCCPTATFTPDPFGAKI